METLSLDSIHIYTGVGGLSLTIQCFIKFEII